MIHYQTVRRHGSAAFLGLCLVVFAGCSSARVKGLLEYRDGTTSTAGDSVQVHLYGSRTCGATILNVGEDHKWEYPPAKKNLRQWSTPLPSLKSKKGQEAPVFVFQAVKKEDAGVISTQAQRVTYAEYLKLPDTARVIRLIYEASEPRDTSNTNNDVIDFTPK